MSTTPTKSLRKLHNHLSRPIVSNADVVYLLSQVRRLLENEKPNPRPFVLWMHCHWALHVNLTFSGTTMHFLRRVDDYIVNNVAGFTRDPSYNMLDSHWLFNDLIYMDPFRRELRSFLVDHGMPTGVCDEEPAWFAFVSAYADIIEDGALSCSTTKSDGLRAIEKVIFTKAGPPMAADSLLNFIVQWDVVLKDERILRMGLEAKPGRKMLFWGAHLIAAPAATSLPNR